MENASKALLIAGAVLIAILLISVGIMIYSGASGIFSKGGAAMSDADIAAFNTKWENYEGTRQSAKVVRDMITAVKFSNDDENNAKVKVNNLEPTGEEVINAGYYTITVEKTNNIVSDITYVAI